MTIINARCDVFKFRPQRREIQGLNHQTAANRWLFGFGHGAASLEKTQLSRTELPNHSRPIYSGRKCSIMLNTDIHHFQALQQRRSQLDNMLIVPPQHMELVNGYIHCGWVAVDQGGSDGSAYDKPWQWLMRNQGMHIIARDISMGCCLSQNYLDVDV